MARYVPLGNITKPQRISNNKKEPIDWFTSNGARIPIYEGQTKQQAFVAYVEKRNAEIREKIKRDEQEQALKNQQMQKAKEEADKRNNENIKAEDPIINTKFYKSTTQQMKDIVTDVYKDMQEEFPILKKAVTFDFLNGGGCEAIGDSISMDGRYMKSALKTDKEFKEDYGEMRMRSTTAHELTHVIQSRIGVRERLRTGTKIDEEEITGRILNTAIDKYVRDNSGTSKEQILKDLKKAYGLRTLDCDPSRRPMMERMAMAMQYYYMDTRHPKVSSVRAGANKSLAQIGYYIAEELKREMR